MNIKSDNLHDKEKSNIAIAIWQKLELEIAQ